MATVVGLFERYEDADRALHALNDMGFGKEDISVVAPEEKIRTKLSGEHGTAEDTAKTGAVVGGLAGLLVGVGAIVAPGVGHIITIGALATALGSGAVGAGIGAAAGGLRGALREMHVPDAEATVIEDSVKQGGILITVVSEEDRIPEIKQTMRDSNAVDLEARRNLSEQGREADYRQVTAKKRDERTED
jgi:uncharacterized membrane protein